ncbi:hypothetical protein ACH33_17730 [Aneurinibacillus sp. XH2]|nr:hypothetical protein ACH33_17730 [Aneurinibacillus sp. XH2]
MEDMRQTLNKPANAIRKDDFMKDDISTLDFLKLLTKLDTLVLSNHQIKDISPCKALKNLTWIYAVQR